MLCFLSQEYPYSRLAQGSEELRQNSQTYLVSCWSKILEEVTILGREESHISLSLFQSLDFFLINL